MECACACVLRVVENFVVAYLDVEHPYVQREMTYRKISPLRRLGQLARNEEQRGEREREKVCVLVQLVNMLHNYTCELDIHTTYSDFIRFQHLRNPVHFWRAGAIQLMIAAGNVLISIVLDCN